MDREENSVVSNRSCLMTSSVIRTSANHVTSKVLMVMNNELEERGIKR
jgi:hypothetical protein